MNPHQRLSWLRLIRSENVRPALRSTGWHRLPAGGRARVPCHSTLPCFRADWSPAPLRNVDSRLR